MRRKQKTLLNTSISEVSVYLEAPHGHAAEHILPHWPRELVHLSALPQRSWHLVCVQTGLVGFNVVQVVRDGLDGLDGGEGGAGAVEP